MNTALPRRAFLVAVPAFAAAASGQGQPASAEAAPASSFPFQDPAKVKEIVGASHRDIDRVRALLKEAPQLANATYDWGYGDWESALGAASHVGRADIANLLIEHGAVPTVFTMAMLGRLSAVRAMIEASPGLQRMRGPHGLTLLMHAQAGGEDASPVAEYLKGLGDADQRYTNIPLTEAERARLLGEYSFGLGKEQRIKIGVRERDKLLTIERVGANTQNIFHQGSNVFHPAGAPDVRIAFRIEADKAVGLTITTPAPVCSATRV